MQDRGWCNRHIRQAMQCPIILKGIQTNPIIGHFSTTFAARKFPNGKRIKRTGILFAEVCFLLSKEPLIKSSADRVSGAMRMIVRRATKVPSRSLSTRSATKQAPHCAETRMGRGFSGDLLCRSACEGGSTIRCASLRASHPEKPAPRPRGT